MLLVSELGHTESEWDLIADLLRPGVERLLLSGHSTEPDPVEVEMAPVRPLPPRRGKQARVQWILDYLAFAGSATRKEMVEASGIPNSTMGRLISEMLRDDRIVASGTTNDREYHLEVE